MNEETNLSMDERLASLFQPDTLLPEQFLETFRRRSHLEPEKGLMLAVLEDAVACFQKYLLARDSRGKALFRDAERWIMEKDGDWLFSFENICEALGFEPDYLRAGLLRWKEAKLNRRPKAQIFRLAPRRSEVEDEAAGSDQTGRRLVEAAGR